VRVAGRHVARITHWQRRVDVPLDEITAGTDGVPSSWEMIKAVIFDRARCAKPLISSSRRSRLRLLPRFAPLMARLDRRMV
jgi:hypothetical protein